MRCQGCWLHSPSGPASVAIKILQEGTSPSQNKELLEEARVMASVKHPCCVRIQAVCMTAHMMLVSELLPTGSLLDYVRARQFELSSATLLLWAKQIAEVYTISVQFSSVQFIQGDHLSGKPGKPGNVREFGTCQGNVRDVVNSQGIVREMSGKKSCHGKVSQNC